MDDDELIVSFEGCRLDPEAFDHRTHLRVAWIYLVRHGLAGGGERMTAALKRFVEAVGAGPKYHETMTQAWLRLLGGAQDATGAASFDDLLKQRPELTDKDLPLRHYHRETLFSDRARGAWVEPDRSPLPGGPFVAPTSPWIAQGAAEHRGENFS